MSPTSLFTVPFFTIAALAVGRTNGFTTPGYLASLASSGTSAVLMPPSEPEAPTSDAPSDYWSYEPPSQQSSPQLPILPEGIVPNLSPDGESMYVFPYEHQTELYEQYDHMVDGLEEAATLYTQQQEQQAEEILENYDDVNDDASAAMEDGDSLYAEADEFDNVSDYHGFQSDISDYRYWVSLFDDGAGDATAHVEEPQKQEAERERISESFYDYDDEDDEEEDDYIATFDGDLGNDEHHPVATNVLGTMLRPCAESFCTLLLPEDEHSSVCCKLTDSFLESNHGWYLAEFGLQAGHVGCISAEHWMDAYNDGVAPPLYLEATHAVALDDIDIDFLRAHADDHAVALERLQELQIVKAKLNKLMKRKGGGGNDEAESTGD